MIWASEQKEDNNQDKVGVQNEISASYSLPGAPA